VDYSKSQNKNQPCIIAPADDNDPYPLGKNNKAEIFAPSRRILLQGQPCIIVTFGNNGLYFPFWQKSNELSSPGEYYTGSTLLNAALTAISLSAKLFNMVNPTGRTPANSAYLTSMQDPAC